MITDPINDPRLMDWTLPASDRCLLITPMRTRGEVQGILSLVCEQSHDFTPDDIKLAASVADHMGVAIDNANLQSQSEQAAIFE